MADTGIELKQLTNWFVNNRKRFWKPRVEARLQEQHAQDRARQLAHQQAAAAAVAESAMSVAARVISQAQSQQFPQQAVSPPSSIFVPPACPQNGHNNHTSPHQFFLAAAAAAVATQISEASKQHQQYQLQQQAQQHILSFGQQLQQHNQRLHAQHQQKLHHHQQFQQAHCTINAQKSNNGLFLNQQSELKQQPCLSFVSDTSSDQSFSNDSASDDLSTSSSIGLCNNMQRVIIPPTQVNHQEQLDMKCDSVNSQRDTVTRSEFVDVHIIAPLPTAGSSQPTIKDVTIISPKVEQQADLLKSYRNCEIKYVVSPGIIGDRRKVQSRRDAEIVRIKKHYLREFTASLPFNNTNFNKNISEIRRCKQEISRSKNIPTSSGSRPSALVNKNDAERSSLLLDFAHSVVSVCNKRKEKIGLKRSRRISTGNESESRCDRKLFYDSHNSTCVVSEDDSSSSTGDQTPKRARTVSVCASSSMDKLQNDQELKSISNAVENVRSKTVDNYETTLPKNVTISNSCTETPIDKDMESWRTACRKASIDHCMRLPTIEEAAHMFGHRQK
eukprot:CAMPEP_0194366282 /NCGR_PEP_ID=MMETSP0174-20130528/14307_1 /TAXON_ID=216777 /ORGANISM="Proboscia alata, Strain PI-D3" /LENGTH=557 /DNA_ID=CAMNT_0039141375 /DNA_START=373 /DNA_END=2046 /DNA_ORIENTATION=+